MSKKKLADKAFIAKYEAIFYYNDAGGCFFLFLIMSGILSFVTITGVIISFANGKFEDALIALDIFLILTAICIYGIDLHDKRKKKKVDKELDMNEEQATNLYRLLSNNAIPWFQRICMLNPSAKLGQMELLKEWYNFNDKIVSEYIFEKECSEEELLKATANSLSEKKNIVENLFKLAIVEDGIHNDEWELLMNVLEQFEFNKNYIEYFIRRYSSLRTESEDSSNNESTSTGEKNVHLLKPYYDLLGLEVGASDEEIKKAYHNLALQHHPDMKKNAGRTKECEDMMAKINEAVEKIRN